MISASGGDPLERGGGAAFIFWVIRLMNDLDPEALARSRLNHGEGVSPGRTSPQV